MEKVIIVYGSTTGTTEEMSKSIGREIKSLGHDVVVKNVSGSTTEELSGYGLIILGCSTWGDGELQDDFIDFEEKLRAVGLKDKKCAVFGPGESVYPQFCKAVDILEETLKQRGACLVTEGLKFDVVLTNPPFGEDRKWEPKTKQEEKQAEMYELWNIARSGNWIDLGLVFLENAYRILNKGGRMGIIVSNSIASIDRWNKARQWLMEKMRIVALFDLPANVFADTGVNTTLIVAYKPKENELKKLQESNYNVFVKDIKNVGYEVRTSKRVKYFNPIYKINERTFKIEQDEEGNPLIDEEFTENITEFRKWCLGQEKTLQDLFVKEK